MIAADLNIPLLYYITYIMSSDVKVWHYEVRAQLTHSPSLSLYNTVIYLYKSV